MGARRWRLVTGMGVLAASVAAMLAVPLLAGSIPADGTVDFDQVVPATHAIVPSTAKGVAYVADARQVVLSDSTDQLLYFYDADTGSLLATSSGAPAEPFLLLGDIAPRPGGVWVADLIRKKYYSVDLDGSVVKTVAMPSLGTDGMDATGNSIWGVSTFYGLVFRSRTDVSSVTTYGAGGSLDYPTDVASGPAGPYVTDTYHHRIVSLNASGTVSREWNTSSLDASFTYPGYIDTDSSGRMWVSSPNKLYGIDPSLATTNPANLLGGFGSEGVGDGQFRMSGGVSADSTEGVWVAGQSDARAQLIGYDGTFIRKVGGGPGNGEGEFFDPSDVAMDATGNVFVSDRGNNRVQKFDPSGVFIAQYGPFDGSYDLGLGVGPDGTLWIAESAASRVWRVSPSGELTSFGSQGTGLGQFKWPADVAVAEDGAVIVADSGNGRLQRLTSGGTAVEAWNVGGSPESVACSSDGRVVYLDSGTGRIHVLNAAHNEIAILTGVVAPGRIAVDSACNIYVACTDSFVRMYTRYGAQTLSWGGQGTTQGRFRNAVGGIAVAPNGTVWTSDSWNNRLQRFTVHDHTPPTSSASDVGGWQASDTMVTITGVDTPGRVSRFLTSLDGEIAQTDYPLPGLIAYTTNRTVTKEGTSTLEFRAVDGFGNEETSQSVTVQVDKSAPTMTFSGEPDDWVSHPVTLTVEADDPYSGVAGISLWGAIPAGPYGGQLVVSAEGSQSIQGQAHDNVGHYSDTFYSKPVRIDTSQPFVSVWSDYDPGNPTNPVSVSAYAWDQYSGVATAWVRIDDGPWASLGDPVPVYFAGVHTAEVIAWDLTGNVATASCPPFTVASEGGAPSGGFEVDGGHPWSNKVMAPVRCSVAGATEMRFKVGTDSWGDFAAYSSDTTITLPDSEGSYDVVAEFKDGAGSTVTRTVSIGIDRTQPTTTTSNVTETAIRRVATEFIFVGHDALSGPGGCAYRLDAGPVQYGDTCPVSEPGSHTIEYWAYDLAGNEGAHSIADFFMTHRPQLEVTMTPAPVPAGETATVKARLVDEEGAPVPGAMVWINMSSNGTDFDPTLGVDTTDSNGEVSFAASPVRSTWYRAGFAETDEYNGAVSGVHFVAPLAPTVTIASVSPTLVEYAGAVTVRGQLVSASGKTIGGSSLVELWAKPYGSTWRKVAAAPWSSATGRYTATYRPTIRTQLQLRFPSNPLATSSEVTVKARAKVGTPSAPSTMYHTKYYTVWGYLYPKHTAGSSVVTLTFKRYSSGRWITKKTVYAKAKDYSSSCSKYSASVKLTTTGTYRIYATHIDAGHETKTSSYRQVKVR